MSAKFTAGPYRLSAATMDGFRPIMAPGGVIVAMVSILAPNHAATGRLLAAAPDLLAALTDLINSFEKHRPKEYWDAARAAIIKATGE